MPRQDVLSIITYFLVLFSLGFPLGKLIAQIFKGEVPSFFSWLAPIEKGIYRITGINPLHEQKAKDYLKDLLIFNFIGLVFLIFLFMFQNELPLNPNQYPNLSLHLAFNTAASFMTNTNWQAYSGEATLSNLSQSLGLTSQNFLSAATGLAIVALLAKSMTRKEDGKIGNFGVDLVRSSLYILLPLSIILSVLLVSQGVVQSFSSFPQITTLEGQSKTIPLGPVASQVAIKQLGTNGGGFFGVNSAHPFENPTPFSNFLQMISLLLIPFAQVIAFGILIQRRRDSYALLSSMLLLFIPLLILALWSEHQYLSEAGMLLEGKELRFGITDSVLWGVSTTAASNGSVNAMHSSFSPLATLVFLFQILTGEVIFGGDGSGLYGIALYTIITLFLAGLMVGRSPEWLGKKIEAYEVKLALYALLVPCAVILIGTSFGLISDWGLTSLSHRGPHGLSELLYGFASTAGNNGSAFAGLNANTPILNTLFALSMIIGRFVVIIPIVLIAGSLSQKKIIPPSAGTFPTDGPLFVVLLAGIILIFGALTFFPVLALGPIAEHFLLLIGGMM